MVKVERIRLAINLCSGYSGRAKTWLAKACSYIVYDSYVLIQLVI